METKSVERLQKLHPKIRQAALDAYTEAVKITPSGVHPYVDQTLRTFAESDALYAQGRTKPGEIVTKAKAGQSYHNYGLALDFHLQINDKDVWNEKDPNWMKVVNVFKKHGFEWGGEWKSIKDYPHLQMIFDTNWRKYLAKYNSGNVFTDTNGLKYVNI